MITKKKRLVCLFALLWLVCFPAAARSARITDVRFWSAPDHTRIVLDLTDPVRFDAPPREKTPQFQMELKGVSLQTRTRAMEVNDPFVRKLTIEEPGKDTVRLIFQQKRPLKVDVFALKPYLDKPHRLVVDLIDPSEERKEQEERVRVKEGKQKGARVIVIDPGHGGEDPGAVGPSRMMEKDIVFRVGQRVMSILQSRQNAKVFLTRRGDYFVPLEGRVKIAREVGADLFVSIHADASFNAGARGSSVYCLSLSGATDQAAKVLADKENTSNILGGAVLRPASLNRDPKVNQILLDLMQNNTMKESSRLAELLLQDLKNVNRLKYETSRQANFVVLRAPDIPSVLIETSYVSNKEDERLLCSSDFQDRLADAITAGIDKFFRF
jgi:N-acetylmuramoyl-L-alanine amidase